MQTCPAVKSLKKIIFSQQFRSEVLTENTGESKIYTVTVRIYGVVAQLVECLVRIQEVVGSNPISSTRKKQVFRLAFFNEIRLHQMLKVEFIVISENIQEDKLINLLLQLKDLEMLAEENFLGFFFSVY